MWSWLLKMLIRRSPAKTEAAPDVYSHQLVEQRKRELEARMDALDMVYQVYTRKPDDDAS